MEIPCETITQFPTNRPQRFTACTQTPIPERVGSFGMGRGKANPPAVATPGIPRKIVGPTKARHLAIVGPQLPFVTKGPEIVTGEARHVPTTRTGRYATHGRFAATAKEPFPTLGAPEQAIDAKPKGVDRPHPLMPPTGRETH
jgi:hypothetical protein